MRYAVIMAGGSGTRLWPLSHKQLPKQLIRLVLDDSKKVHKSLLQLAYERAATIVEPENVLIVTSEQHADLVAAQLPQISPENIMREPLGRDSLNAAAWATAAIHNKDSAASISLLTADHLISPLETFAATMHTAYQLAETNPNALVCIGVVPKSPHTGYGYLLKGEPFDSIANTFRVSKFVEKPDFATASDFVASGNYLWNAGMFCWNAATFLTQLRLLQPVSHANVSKIVANPVLVAELFPLLPKISLDYAIMEPVSQGLASAEVLGVALEADWRDIGGYPALASLLDADDQHNASTGNVVTLAAGNNILINADPDTLIAVAGISDLIVVRTPQATLIVPAAMSEMVKDLAENVRGSFPNFC
ncbi:MAG: sugar phosphate nucleotidyltransferase [Propionibacteriaceae bacterium]|nr:sugar phosphate nucleotidyltransferase [Propionibacteriaceae bacterium]